MTNESIFLFLNNFAGQSAFFDGAILFFAEYFIYIFVLGAVFFVARSRDKVFEKIIIIFGGAIFAWVISQAINWFYPVARPFLALPDVNLLFPHGDHDAFPSGHATFSFALAMGIFFYKKKLGALFALGALFIGISRVIAGVHWPLDIVGGLILGALTTALFYFLRRKFFA